LHARLGRHEDCVRLGDPPIWGYTCSIGERDAACCGAGTFACPNLDGYCCPAGYQCCGNHVGYPCVPPGSQCPE